MHKILNTLKREHKSNVELLAIFEQQINLIALAKHPDIDIVDGIVEYFGSFLLRIHHPKEEIVLASLKARCPEDAAMLSVINDDHYRFYDRIHTFSETVHGVLGEGAQVMERQTFVDLAKAFMQSERDHMEREEKDFFPRADKHLSAKDWHTIEAEIAAEPAFDAAASRRHAQLRREIRAWQKENDS